MEAANRRLKKERKKKMSFCQINAPDLKSKQTIKTLRGNTGKQTVQMQEGRKLDLKNNREHGLEFQIQCTV